MATAKKLNRTLRNFIERQPMFFVATAAKDGRVNTSPKGADSLRILNDNKIIWLSLSGSGNETAAHVLDTPRMTLMFCAFDGDPMILRTYGTARVIYPRDENWDDLASQFPKMAGTRQIFELDIDLVQTSCGTGVPVMHVERERYDTELVPYYDDLGKEGVDAYWQRKNLVSIDGKPTGLLED